MGPTVVISTAKVVDILQRCKWSLKFYGLRGTLLHVALKCLKLFRVGRRLQHGCWQKMESRFDSRFGVKTTDWFGVDTFLYYEPSSVLGLYRKLARLTIAYEQYTFIDYGSGKGKALLIASEYSFKRIIGVELSEACHRSALDNISSYRSRTQKCSDLESVCSDARLFKLPLEPTVIYMFNPFPREILAEVMAIIHESVKLTPRHLIVIYGYALHRDVVDKSGFLTKIGQDESFWAMYEYRP